jgi:hypothetical protein
VAVARHDDAVLDGVAADDAARGHGEGEGGIVGGRELVHQLAGGRPAVEHAGIALLEHHHAGALDARVVGIDGGRDEVGERHVGDEAAALVDVEHRFGALGPLGDAHLPVQQARLDAYVRNRLGQAECAAPDLPVVARLRRARARQVERPLLGRAALVDGREREVTGEAAGGGARVDPRELERDERQREVLGAVDEAAVLRVEVDGGEARVVELLEQRGLRRRPLVRLPAAGGDEPRDGPARHRASRLHQELVRVSIGEPPHQLADFVGRQRAKRVRGQRPWHGPRPFRTVTI